MVIVKVLNNAVIIIVVPIMLFLLLNETYAMKTATEALSNIQNTVIDVTDSTIDKIAAAFDAEWWRTPLIIALAAVIAPFVTIAFGIKKQIASQEKQAIDSINREQSNRERRDRLERIEAQLNNFYAPLLALSKVSNKLYDDFSKEVGRSRDHYFEENYCGVVEKPKENDIANWMRVMREVFFPINVQREKIVLEHAALVDGKEFPATLVDMLSHIAEFRSVMEKWKEYKSPADAFAAYNKRQQMDCKGELEFKPGTDFPGIELHDYLENCYGRLKNDCHTESNKLI